MGVTDAEPRPVAVPPQADLQAARYWSWLRSFGVSGGIDRNHPVARIDPVRHGSTRNALRALRGSMDGGLVVLTCWWKLIAEAHNWPAGRDRGRPHLLSGESTR